MAISRVKVFVIEILTALDLNNEIDNILNYINGNIDTDSLAADAVTAEKIDGLTGTGSVNLDNIPNGTNKHSVDITATSDNITHASTTKYISYGAADITLPSTNPLDLPASLSPKSRPAAADGSYDVGRIGVNFPDGCIVDSVTVEGFAAAADGEIQVRLFRVSVDGAGIISGVQVGSTITITNDVTGTITGINHTVNNVTRSYYIDVQQKASTDVANSEFGRVHLGIKTTNLKMT